MTTRPYVNRRRREKRFATAGNAGHAGNSIEWRRAMLQFSRCDGKKRNVARARGRWRKSMDLSECPRVRTVDGRPFSLKRRTDVSIWKLARARMKNSTKTHFDGLVPTISRWWMRGDDEEEQEEEEEKEEENRHAFSHATAKIPPPIEKWRAAN